MERCKSRQFPPTHTATNTHSRSPQHTHTHTHPVFPSLLHTHIHTSLTFCPPPHTLTHAHTHSGTSGNMYIVSRLMKMLVEIKVTGHPVLFSLLTSTQPNTHTHRHNHQPH